MMWSNAESSLCSVLRVTVIFLMCWKNSGEDIKLLPICSLYLSRESDYEPSIHDPKQGWCREGLCYPNSLTFSKQKVETICFLKMYIFIFVRTKIMMMM